MKKLIQYSTERIFSQNILQMESITIYLLNSLKLLKQFLIKTKQVYDLNFNPNVNFVLKDYEITLHEPLMTYRLSNLRIISSDIYKQIRNIQLKQYFFLSPNLQLNISVHYMYFSSTSFLKCFFGSLNIFFKIVHDEYPDNMHYKYCGIIPSFTLYPASDKVTICISTNPIRITFDTIISYSIIDSKRIMSCPEKRTKYVAPITIVKLLSIDSYLLKYQLEVEKI